MEYFDDVFEDMDNVVEEAGKPVNYVAFVADHSGSMFSMSEEAKNGLLKQIKKVKNESGDMKTYVTLIEFDDTVRVICDNDKPERALEAMDKQYWIGGLTSLNDAIMKSISMVKSRMEDDKSEDKSALVIVMTDGHENSSKEYGGMEGTKKVKEIIKNLEDTNEWTFTFAGAGLDVDKVAVDGLGMSAGNTFNASFDNASGLRSYTLATTNGIGKYFNARKIGEKSIKDFYEGVDEHGNKEEGKVIEKEKSERYTAMEGKLEELKKALEKRIS